MNNFILIPLCVAAWILTLVRLRTIFLKKDEPGAKTEMALNIWAMMAFFSITITFMIDEFAAFFNVHTFPNLSLLITHFAFLASQYFAITTTLVAINIPSTQRAIRWIKSTLCTAVVILLAIYSLLISKMTDGLSDSPQNLPIVIFKLVSYPFGIMLFIILIKTYLTYLPSKSFALMRLRAIIVISCSSSAAVYILVRVLIYSGYFWPILLSPWLFTISYIFLFCATILLFAAFLSDKIYARFVVMSRSIEGWRAFQDLQYLVQKLLLLCPIVALPVNHPSIWKFLLKPEYYIYCAIIIILDGKIMLADFLAASAEPDEPTLWDDELLLEAIRVDQALQSINPSNDFYEIVDAYRCVSRELFNSKNSASEYAV